jgi:hypothetical protein
LGELTKYRLETEFMDAKDRLICRNTARSWYRKALLLDPSDGMLYFELGLFAWPELLPQLSFFMRATICRERPHRGRDKALDLLSPFLSFKRDGDVPLVESAFATTIAVLLGGGHSLQYHKALCTVRLVLDCNIGCILAAKFRTTGACVALSLCAAVLGFGTDDSILFTSIHGSDSSHAESLRYSSDEAVNLSQSPPQDHLLDSPVRVAAYACILFCSMTTIVLSRCHDSNILSFAHIILNFLSGMALHPTAFVFLADFVPWNVLVRFLNVLVERQDITQRDWASGLLPRGHDGDTPTLPEDVLLRGAVWESSLPVMSLDGQQEDEQIKDGPSHDRARAKLCLRHAARIVQVPIPSRALYGERLTAAR